MNEVLRSRFGRLQRAAFVLGGLGLVLCGLGAMTDARQFFVSYLVAFVFWIGLSLGCLGVAMIHYLTGGSWGYVTRRFLEAGYMTLPLMAIVFVPLCFGLHELYSWTRPEVVAASELLQRKQIYLNIPSFVIRSLFFLSVWLTMASYLRRWSLHQDSSAKPSATIRMRTLSGPGMVIYPLTATFALVDWVMSIEPAWFSSIFAVIVMIGQILTTFAFVTFALCWVRDQPPFRDVATAKLFHDLGNLLLAFVVFWTYVSFSQLLIIYSGNLPREIDWYLHRTAGGWKWVAGLLAVFHFLAPFVLLLFRTVKRSASRLAVVAAWVFGVHIMEVFWIITPTFHPGGIHVHWLDFTAVLGVGGVWLGLFAANVKRHALLPQNDPRIEHSTAGFAHAK
jgi:hypothetical protein